MFNKVPADVSLSWKKTSSAVTNPVIRARRGDHTAATAAADPFIQLQERAESEKAEVKRRK